MHRHEHTQFPPYVTMASGRARVAPPPPPATGIAAPASAGHQRAMGAPGAGLAWWKLALPLGLVAGVVMPVAAVLWDRVFAAALP